MAATTVGGLAAEILSAAQGHHKGTLTALNGVVATTTETTVTLDPNSGVHKGQRLGINAEVMQVVSVSGQTVTVVRGVGGSTAATHADNDRVYLSWRWYQYDVEQAMADEIRSWPYELFNVGSEDLAIVSTSLAYPMVATDFRFSLLLELDTGDTYGRTRIVKGDIRENATGLKLQLDCAIPSGTLTVMYAADFTTTTFVSATALLTVGIEERLHDIVRYGVLARLLDLREPERSQRGAQPDPREAEETRVLDTARQAQALKARRDLRVEEEIERLRFRWPIRF
jgi:hypothetical protein